jgi:hypothetical protein
MACEQNSQKFTRAGQLLDLRATANPVEVIVARTEQGRGVMGVIDGSSPKGIEGPAEISARKDFLRKIGYKR